MQEAASPKAIDRDAAARALAAAKSAVSASEANAEGEISVLETRRFAGKNIQVSIPGCICCSLNVEQLVIIFSCHLRQGLELL